MMISNFQTQSSRSKSTGRFKRPPLKAGTESSIHEAAAAGVVLPHPPTLYNKGKADARVPPGLRCGKRARLYCWIIIVIKIAVISFLLGVHRGKRIQLRKEQMEDNENEAVDEVEEFPEDDDKRNGRGFDGLILDDALKDPIEFERQRKKHASMAAYDLLVEEFGPKSSFYVQFEVSFLDANGQRVNKSTLSSSSSSLSYFTVRMAPSYLMPRSVLLFLQQVSYGLWSGTTIERESSSFVVETEDSSISSIPVQEQEEWGRILIDPEPENLQRMKDLGLAHLAMGEYSQKYLQHTKYSLGYVGNTTPGPAFFINSQDNYSNNQMAALSTPQAPNKGGSVLANGAEPCFAEVVLGFDTVDAIIRVLSSTDPMEDSIRGSSSSNGGATAVRIESASVLDSWNDAIGSDKLPENYGTQNLN